MLRMRFVVAVLACSAGILSACQLAVTPAPESGETPSPEPITITEPSDSATSPAALPATTAPAATPTEAPQASWTRARLVVDLAKRTKKTGDWDPLYACHVADLTISEAGELSGECTVNPGPSYVVTQGQVTGSFDRASGTVTFAVANAIDDAGGQNVWRNSLRTATPGHVAADGIAAGIADYEASCDGYCGGVTKTSKSGTGSVPWTMEFKP